MTMTPDLPIAPPGAVIFDLDGTLVDTVETRIRAWLAVFDEEGIPAERDRVAALIGADGRKLAREIGARSGTPIDGERAEEIDRRSGEIYEELNRDPRPLPGAQELLAELSRRGMRWAIATSSRAAQVGRSVEALGLPQPPMIVDGSHVEHAKPEPDLLLFAATTLETPPERCWYVGDSTWDMTAAVAAGMTAIGITTGAVDAPALQRAGARRVIGSLDELVPLLAGSGEVTAQSSS